MGLSVSAVSAKQAQYYIDAVAKGREDYYSGHGEAAPTAFKGRSDGLYERPEQVSVETVAEVLKLEEDDRRKNVAFDLAFSVPKSVSVLWATGDAETRAIIEKNLRIAAEAGVGSMRWYAREGHAGARILEVGAPETMFDFRHRTSRALEPQIHSHILVENRVTVNGRDLTLDGREVYAQAKNGGMVFDAVLRRGLTEDLGVAWGPTKANGASGDIRGVDKELMAFWSTRRKDIEAKLDEWRAEFEAATGREPTATEQRKAAQGFTLSTRQKKTGSHSTEDLLSRWHDEAAPYQTETLTDAQSAASSWAAAQRGTREDIQNRLVGARPSRGDSADALVAAVDAHNQPTLNRWQLQIEARKILPQREGETPAQWNARVEALCEQAAASGGLVAISGEASSPRSERYTSKKQIAKEREVIFALGASGHYGRAGRRLAGKTAEYAQAAVAAGTLSAEQAEAIQALASAETTGVALIGAPGVGKTTALGELAEAAHDAGWTVTGLAATGRAASELAEATERGEGQSSTIANWLIERQREAGLESQEELVDRWKGGQVKVGEAPRHELIILDEASITGTDDLEKIAAYASFSGGKVILVGDHRQIGSVEKGGVLLGIATAEGEEAEKLGLAKIPTANIETVVRQKEEWERRAAEQLRAGGKAAEAAVDAYAGHGRVHAVAGTLEAKREIATRMADDVAAGKESIAIGYTGNAVNQLNAAVVAELVQRGELPEETLSDFRFRAGQQVITRKNVYEATETGREMVVKNGDRWTVLGQTGSGQNAGLVVEKLGGGERRTLDRRYVEATITGGGKQVQGGYASTPITIQSASLDGSSYTLASESATASSLLVPMTRGKDANHIFIPVGVEARQHDPLMATNDQRDPQKEAADWLKAKAAAAPGENDKAAIHHVAQARERATAIKEAERRERAEVKAKERGLAQQQQEGGRMI